MTKLTDEEIKDNIEIQIENKLVEISMQYPEWAIEYKVYKEKTKDD
jgi:hypothetical protein